LDVSGVANRIVVSTSILWSEGLVATITATLKMPTGLANCISMRTCGGPVVERSDEMFGPGNDATDLLL
jgi:hypothetical protein